MEIIVYSGFSKRINSTKRPSGGTTIDVALKSPTSVITPTFRLTGFNTAWNYIQWGNRYYFVDNIVILTNDIAEYSCSLDVLATYKDTIGASSQYVVRAASAYNLNIIDSKYPTLAPIALSEKTFDTLHASFTNGGSFVVAISNGVGVESAGVTYYVLNDVTMARLLGIMFDGTWLTASDITVELQKELVNPMQYIDSIKWYPFDIANSGLIGLGQGEIKFGYWGTGITAPTVNVNDSICSFAEEKALDNHPQYARGTYLNGTPFTQMSLLCYGFGQIPIDASIFINHFSILLGIGVDVVTGLGRLRLRTGGANSQLFYTQYGQVGVDCKISQITQGLIESVGDILGGAWSIKAHNPLGFAAGVVSGLEALAPQLRSSGANGSKITFTIPPTLTIKRQSLTPEDRAQFGRPLCEVMQIGQLNGFVQCENVDVDSVGTASEKRAIIEYMEGGFFYE